MKEVIEKIKAVVGTLDGGLNGVPMTYDNMSKLVGCMQVLSEVIRTLEKQEAENGNADAE